MVLITNGRDEVGRGGAHEALSALEKYAGWLGHEYTTRITRLAIARLRPAINGPDEDLAMALKDVEAATEQLQTVELRAMCRTALRQLQRSLRTEHAALFLSRDLRSVGDVIDARTGDLSLPDIRDGAMR